MRESNSLSKLTVQKTVIATGIGIVLTEEKRHFIREHGPSIGDILYERAHLYNQVTHCAVNSM